MRILTIEKTLTSKILLVYLYFRLLMFVIIAYCFLNVCLGMSWSCCVNHLNFCKSYFSWCLRARKIYGPNQIWQLLKLWVNRNSKDKAPYHFESNKFLIFYYFSVGSQINHTNTGSNFQIIYFTIILLDDYFHSQRSLNKLNRKCKSINVK